MREKSIESWRIAFIGFTMAQFRKDILNANSKEIEKAIDFGNRYMEILNNMIINNGYFKP